MHYDPQHCLFLRECSKKDWSQPAYVCFNLLDVFHYFEKSGSSLLWNVKKQHSHVSKYLFFLSRIQKNMLMDLSKEIMMDLGITVIGDIIAILKHAKQVYRQVGANAGFWCICICNGSFSKTLINVPIFLAVWHYWLLTVYACHVNVSVPIFTDRIINRLNF